MAPSCEAPEKEFLGSQSLAQSHSLAHLCLFKKCNSDLAFLAAFALFLGLPLSLVGSSQQSGRVN